MNKLMHKIVILGIFLFFTGCEDVLEKYSGDQMSDESFFLKPTDFEFYVNDLYRGDNSFVSLLNYTKWQLANGTDDVVTGNNPAGALMRHSVSGQAPNSSSTWDNAYAYIRKVNYVLQNEEKANPTDKAAQHFIGEAYFCRAHRYFVLLQEFGDVPYIDKVLSTDSEELYKPRDSRNIIAGKIIEDLDKAIPKLYWKGEGKAVAGRINKETALILKSRVALFEGSWEYYHGKKSTPFKVEGQDGIVFLDKAIEAGDELIARHGTNVFRGRPGYEYEDLFNKDDYEKITGAFFYKIFSADLSLTQDYKTFAHPFPQAPTKSAIDAYLMSDGKPVELSSVTFDKTKQSSLLRSRDPRLAQTVYPPDRGGYLDLYNINFPVEDEYNVIYPDMLYTYSPNATGYRIIKGLVTTSISILQNESDNLLMRYEEALLNYAEAKAIKGTLTQQDIDKTINVLRNRVGMVPMKISEVNSWGIMYREEDGYDPSAPNVLNEVRRERRIELMFEGFRSTDIKRWALYDKVFNGHKPLGAFFKEVVDYWNNKENLLNAGMTEARAKTKALIIGSTIGQPVGEYIRPLWKNSEFSDGGRGYYIDPNRDYLQAVPKGEIDLYENKGGVVLTQNPGWF